MKKVGIIGGLGPESTVDYYKSIISKFQKVKNNQKILPELIINSIDMYRVFKFIDNQDLSELADYLIAAVDSLASAGVDFAVLSANTPHIVYDQVKEGVGIPLISIVEATLKEASKQNLNKVGLMGTRFTMENDFYNKPFAAIGKEIIVPTKDEINMIHEKVEEELEIGVVKEETKQKFLAIIQRMIADHHIEGLILGCTELPLLLKSGDADIPFLNTTEIHVNSIIKEIS